MTTDPWLSISDYAREYGVDRSTVYKFLDAGLVVFYRVKADGLCVVRIRNLPPSHSTSLSVDVGRC